MNANYLTNKEPRNDEVPGRTYLDDNEDPANQQDYPNKEDESPDIEEEPVDDPDAHDNDGDDEGKRLPHDADRNGGYSYESELVDPNS